MRRTTSVLLGLAAAALLPLAAVATPAAAASPHPWSDTASSDFVAAAGTRCPFALQGTVLSDREQARVVDTYPDGSVRTEEVVGQLVMRFTNLDTGASVERNLTGTGYYTLNPDGSPRSLTLQGGHFAAGIPAGSPDGPAYLVFTGAGSSVTFNRDGTRTVTYGAGSAENLCQTLA